MERPKATFTIDKNILMELDSVAKELGKKKSHIVEQALELYFDAVDAMIADSRLDGLASGKDKAIPAEEVWKELGL